MAKNTGNSVEAIRIEAQSILDEIAHKMALPAVRTVASILRSVLKKVLKAIYVNEDGVKLVSLAVTRWCDIS